MKPANVLVTDSGTVKILDFGIARVIEHALGLTGHGSTNTAIPIATIRYASPEQLERRRSGRSSDIYSLGIILYELLTGRHPFPLELEGGPGELAAAMSSRLPVSLSKSLNPSYPVPAGADPIVLKALRYDPERRYRSASEFLQAIRTFLENRLTPRGHGAIG